MMGNVKIGPALRRGIAPVLTIFIVLGLTLSGVSIGGRTGVAITEARVAAPEGGPDLAAAPKRARKGAERQHKHKQKARKQKHHQQKDHKHQDGKHKQKGSDNQGGKEKEPTREQGKQDGTGQQGKRDSKAVSSQSQGQQQELTSGRLPAAETVAAASEAQLSAKDRYIVVLDDTIPNSLSAARGIATDAPGVVPTHVYSNVFQGFAAVIPDQALAAVRRNPQVKAVVPDEVVHTAAHTIPTGISRIDADVNPTARIDGVDERVDVDVAVLDTAGFNTHPDVNAWAWANCTDSSNNSDDNGHGTHVGGTIGALDNGFGVVGVAPGARLWNIRVLRADPAGGAGGMTSWILCGLDIVRYHATPQADGLGDIEVLNASLGAPGKDSNCQTQVDAYHWAFCKVVAAGVTVVVAAMNDAQDASTVVPATYEEVITVSALADSDGRPGGLGPATSRGQDDSLATFSNFGAEINIAAPGVDILSTVPTGPCELCDPSGYRMLNGTSMASPHVAGAAALYLATHPGASPAQVKSELINSRERIALPGDPDGIAEGVLYVGAGAAPPPPPPPPPPTPPTVDPGSGGGETNSVTSTVKKHKSHKKHKGGKGKKKH
jgi:subtilisin